MSVLFHMLPIFGCLLAIGIVEYLSARLRRWAEIFVFLRTTSAIR